MVKRIFVILLLLGVSVASSTASAPSASAHSTHSTSARTCPSALWSSAGNGFGLSDGFVSVALWKDCNGTYYASANSSTQSDGHAFTGNLYLRVVTPNGVSTPGHAQCGAGICDTNHVLVTSDSKMYWQYDTNNGWLFYNFSGTAHPENLNGPCSSPCSGMFSFPDSSPF